LAFLPYKILASLENICLAFHSVKASDSPLSLEETPKNKKNSFISIIWTKGGIFEPFLSKSKHRNKGRRGQIEG